MTSASSSILQLLPSVLICWSCHRPTKTCYFYIRQLRSKSLINDCQPQSCPIVLTKILLQIYSVIDSRRALKCLLGQMSWLMRLLPLILVLPQSSHMTDEIRPRLAVLAWRSFMGKFQALCAYFPMYAWVYTSLSCIPVSLIQNVPNTRNSLNAHLIWQSNYSPTIQLRIYVISATSTTKCCWIFNQ